MLHLKRRRNQLTYIHGRNGETTLNVKSIFTRPTVVVEVIQGQHRYLQYMTPGDSVEVEPGVHVMLYHIRDGQSCFLAIDAPPEVQVHREEAKVKLINRGES